jgi:hypothetical protein
MEKNLLFIDLIFAIELDLQNKKILNYYLIVMNEK